VVNSTRSPASLNPVSETVTPFAPPRRPNIPVVRSIVVLHGDQTGEELLVQALRLLDRDLIGLELQLHHFDLSLARRRETRNQVVLDAAAALRESVFGSKAATITPEGAEDVGSPNGMLRQAVDGGVIVRTGRRIPSVLPPAPVYSPISVIRMAVDDAYGAKEWREGGGRSERAYRTETMSRRTCRARAGYAFHHAPRRRGRGSVGATRPPGPN